MTTGRAQTLFSFLSTGKNLEEDYLRRGDVPGVRTLSTLNTGQGRSRDRVDTSVEYLGEFGIMEFKSNQVRKKVIDCTSGSLPRGTGVWFFSMLCDDYAGYDGFSQNPEFDFDDYRDILGWCVHVMDRSPLMCPMLKEVCDKGWRVTVDDLQGSDYCIDVEQGLLVLDHHALSPAALGRSDYFRHVMLVAMIKAVRDIWQEKRHGGFDALYMPEHVLFMERVRAADLDVVAIFAAWELRSEGHADLWRHVLGSEIGDMAMIFSGHLERDPSAQFNGQGLTAAFKQWFRCAGRVDVCDRAALDYMDDVLAQRENINPFGRKKPARMNVEMLSCLPDKSAYLQGQGMEILSNPVYAAVDNEINQTHLFHIMYDLEAVVVEDVPFRDAELARKIFPVGEGR